MRRRRFLGLVAAGSAALVVPPACGRKELAPVAALVDALLPPGHGLPGGVEVGVPSYLERTLGERRFAGVARVIGDGIAGLEAQHGPLGRLGREARLAAFVAAPPMFVNAFLDFAMEGYLGQPGGEVHAALGVPGPR